MLFWPDTLTLGVILSLFSLSLFFSYEVLRILDFTVEGSFCFGAVITFICSSHGVNPFVATLCGVLGGLISGFLSVYLSTHFNIKYLLAGILVSTFLFYINYMLLGENAVIFPREMTIFAHFENAAKEMTNSSFVFLFGITWSMGDLTDFLTSFFLLLCILLLFAILFNTIWGVYLCAIGKNSKIVPSFAVSPKIISALVLVLSNGLTALAGSLLVQFEGYLNVYMGFGMLFWGIAVLFLSRLVARNNMTIKLFGCILATLFLQIFNDIGETIGLNTWLIRAVLLLTAIVVLISQFSKTSDETKWT